MKRKILTIAVLALIALTFTGCISMSLSPTTLGSAPASQGTAQSKSLNAIRVQNNETVNLQAGTYTGSLVIDANHTTVIGAGVGRTIIKGDLIITGNANSIQGLTIQGNVSISGNTNDLSGTDLSKAQVSAKGNNNRY